MCIVYEIEKGVKNQGFFTRVLLGPWFQIQEAKCLKKIFKE